MKATSLFCSMTVLLAFMPLAHAIPVDTWIIGGGVGLFDPSEDIGTVSGGDVKLTMDNDAKPIVSAEYFVKNNLSVELATAYPFVNEVLWKTPNIDKIGSQTSILPINVSLNYHFDGLNLPLKARPYVGVGMNYSHFYDEKVNIDNAKLDIEDSIGVTGQVGVDLPVTRYNYIRMNARYMDVKPDVKVNDKKVGDVDISPWLYGVSYMWQY